MDLGPYSSYRLPQAVQASFGVNTAQELADQIGLTGTLNSGVAQEAERAYNAYRAGDQQPAIAFLTSHSNLDEAAIAEVLGKLPQL
jgi:hypothetical protein